MMVTDQVSTGVDNDTRTISRENWEGLFNAFTERNQERTCRLEAVCPEEARLLFEDRPFLSITLDAEQDEPTVVITSGDTSGASPRTARHIIEGPTAVREWQPPDRPFEALEIEVRGEGRLVLTIDPHPDQMPADREEDAELELRKAA